MKKLKQMSGPYCIGFELSSTAHGFVATDPNGNVLYHGKQPVMGTRVFKEGQHAAEARMPRTSRRGIQRRRGREHEMERVFAPVISSIDPNFFIRRRMSYKLGKIRFESDPIGFSYSRLFHSFPTLAHLDVALMESDSAMDPRLIFESVANHVVRRGHFLLENQNVSSTNSDIDTQVANYAEVLVSYFEDTLDERIEPSLEALDINGNVTARELQKRFASAMCVSGDDIQKKTEKAQIKAIADLVAGYKADLTALVPDAEKLPKVSISDGDALEEFLADSCPDSLVPVLMAAQALYTSWKLQGMLSYAPGKSLSHNQVAQHEVYGKQLRMLKNLALKYVAKQDEDGNVDEDGFKDYVRFFGGPKCEDRYRYDKVQVKKQDSPKKNMGYTAYNLNVLGYEEFAKRVELLFKDTDGVNDPQYKTMMEAFANHAFLRRIHTVDNAAIPYQLHVEVVNRIIDNQGRFYPWLIDAREHILKVLTSRIPYYVGPLDSTDHGKAGENGTRFAWVKRLAGHEDAFVSPWNYEDHIDIDTTAELFIRRMTGECSYLDGEDVLAKNSLLYEKYCFFNELASLSFTEDGDSWMPFDAGMRKAIYDAASDGKTMTVKRIESVLQRDFFIAHPHVRGTSNPKAMSSKRSNYAYFCRLFDVKALSASDMSMAEDLVLWNTVFEDRDILRRKILKTYGDLLTEKAVDDFCHKRLSGWGKLSERLLTGIWADTASGDMCVMDVLEQGRPYGRYRGSSMNLMQILNDDVLGFKMEIKRLNDSHMQMAEGFDLNALPGSPALRRGVSQAIKVLDDIVSVAGKAPDRIYLKVTRTASKSDPDTYNAMLEMYARGLAKTAKEKFVRIVRARVLKNTMIELYGERFRIAGEKQVYPVRQMPLAIDEMYLLKGVETIVAAGNAGASARIDFEKTAESLVGFWDLLLEKLPVNYPKLTVQLKLGSLKHPKDILAATSESEFPAIVYKIAEAEIQVMEQASGLRNMSDTKILGGNTFGGSLVFTFNKVLNDPKSKACFIDTTPAGLHEVKTKIW